MRDILKNRPDVAPRVDYGLLMEGISKRTVEEMMDDVLCGGAPHRSVSDAFIINNFGGDEGSCMWDVYGRDLNDNNTMWWAFLGLQTVRQRSLQLLIGFHHSRPNIDSGINYPLPSPGVYDWFTIMPDQALIIDLVTIREIQSQLAADIGLDECSHFCAYGSTYMHEYITGCELAEDCSGYWRLYP